MNILSTTLLVSTVLGSIGLAGCQTTEEDYYYGQQPRRVVTEPWDTDETVYVRRPQRWGNDYGYDRPAPVYRQQQPRYQPPPPPPQPRYQPPPPQSAPARPEGIHRPPQGDPNIPNWDDPRAQNPNKMGGGR